MIDVPAAFAQETIGREDEAGRRWIESLPALAEELLQLWDCTPVPPVTHGRVGLVVPCVAATDRVAC